MRSVKRGSILVMPIWRNVLILFCCFSATVYSAVGHSSGLESNRPVGLCMDARPGSITAALICADKKEAMQQLDVAGCFVAQAPAAVEVRNVWLSRESLPAIAAARDRTVQLFMAQCLVEAHSKTHPPDRAEKSAVVYLRNALKDADPQIAGIAMMSLAPVLNKNDIDTIVKLASTQFAIAMQAVTALGLRCNDEAKLGIAAIQLAYVGSSQD